MVLKTVGYSLYWHCQSMSSSPFLWAHTKPQLTSTHHLKHLMSPTAKKKNLPPLHREEVNNALVHIIYFTSQQE